MRFSHFLRTFVLMNQRIQELSILIPTYNSQCVDLVKRLLQLCQNTELTFEIIVADDGSEDTSANESINLLPHCTYIVKDKNEGSAATRNFLARQSHHEWLLFLDSDISIMQEDFIKRYLSCNYHSDLINGGINVDGCHPDNIRWRYEKDAELCHNAISRQKQGYKEFRTTNFMIRRDVMLRIPFDERFTASGYEDVFYGKQLEQANVSILHIDNPVTMTSFEDNETFMKKTERNLRTLYRFRNELQDYSGIITWSSRLIPSCFWRFIFRHMQKRLRQHLCSQEPNLFIFNLYRLGYFLSIKE